MPRSKADQARLDAIHAMPCFCCARGNIDQPSRTEAHHIVAKSYRKHHGGDQWTIPLCAWHHRADVIGCHKLVDPPTISKCFEVLGPSVHGHKKTFNRMYGGEFAILEIIDDRLRESA